MSLKHPIIAVTGSSGAGTTAVAHSFATIFRHLDVNAAYVNGDAFFRYNRSDMKKAIDHATARGESMSHFGPEANLFEELELLFRGYGETGTGHVRQYVKDLEQAEALGISAGEFTPWEPLPKQTDILFYEGLHGGVAARTWARRRSSPAHLPAEIEDRRQSAKGVDVAHHVDLLLGIVPAINLEWIQKIHRDCNHRGYSAEAVTDTILRRMNDYVYYIVPQFSITDINFQRVPLVDTSNPFIAREVPAADESLVVIHFREPRKHDLPTIANTIGGGFTSRANTLVVPGGKLPLAIELICTPLILDMLDRRQNAVSQQAS